MPVSLVACPRRTGQRVDQVKGKRRGFLSVQMRWGEMGWLLHNWSS